MSEVAPSSSGFIGWFNKTGWRDIIIGTPYGWLIAFFFVPFLIVVAMSLAMTVGRSPPLVHGGLTPRIDREQ